MTRILVLSNLYPPNVVGGYERLCFDVSAGLAEAGHEIVVLTSRYGGRTADYPGQTVLRELDLLTGADIYKPFPGTPEDRESINQRNLVTLRRVLAAVKPNVVFAWNLFFLDASLLDALEQAPVRAVLMLTDNWLLVMRNPIFVRDFFEQTVFGGAPPPRQRLRDRLWGAMPSFARSRGLQAIFGSAYMRDFYGAGGITFGRHRVIHNGVRQDAYAGLPEMDRRQLAEKGVLRLLFAGRLVDLKGAHVAVAAIRELAPETLGVARIQLTLVGDVQDATYMERLGQVIAESGQEGAIVLRPSVPEDALPSLFNAHDIYLFPSLYEPFSLTLIHALALGIPTIATNTGGNPELVEDGKSGLLVPKGDAAALASAVRRLAGDPELRARLAAEGRRAAARCTFTRMLDEMAGFLDQAG